MKLTLEDGREIEGTVEEIERFISGVHGSTVGWGPNGNDEYYVSSSKGIIRIDEMHANHIRNAMNMMRDDDITVSGHMDDFFESSDVTFCAMLLEILKKRLNKD